MIEHLARRLRERGVSQAELARAVGVSPQAVSYWVTGQKQPSSQVEEKLREFLQSRPRVESGRPGDPSGAIVRAQSFVDQCALMLTGAGLEVRPADQELKPPLKQQVDLVATSPQGQRYIVECKLAPSTPKNYFRMHDALARLLLAEVTSDEDDTQFLLLTDRPLPSFVQASVERLRDVRPRLHVIVLEEQDAADRLRALAS
jgi:transcriptional regulator with XRE-family HTH domain